MTQVSKQVTCIYMSLTYILTYLLYSTVMMTDELFSQLRQVLLRDDQYQKILIILKHFCSL